MLDGLGKFFKFVLERSKEINGGIRRESGEDDCENLFNELLLHIDLHGKTVQFWYEIGNIPSCYIYLFLP